jgi:hypothetical protein
MIHNQAFDEKVEDTKGVIRSRSKVKKRQYNVIVFSFVLYSLLIVLSLLHFTTASDYSFGIFNFFIECLIMNHADLLLKK